MSNKSQLSNAFSRVLSKSKTDEKEQNQTLVNQSTSQQVNQNDLYEVKEKELQNLEISNELTSKPVKKLTKQTKELRTVKGFKLTSKPQKIIGLMAQLQCKKEYEIIEQGVELLLEANPEMKGFLNMLYGNELLILERLVIKKVFVG